MLSKESIVKLYKKCSTELPLDIVDSLKSGLQKEEKETAINSLKTILENIEIAKKESKPICQDTGVPVFYVEYPKELSQKEIKDTIKQATIEATSEIPLRPNAVESLTGKNIGNSPIIHFKEAEELKIDLLMKGGGSENISSIYSLPNNQLKANRNIEGIRKCVLDAVFAAQGKGCPPYIIGIGIAGTIEEAAHLSKIQLLRKTNDSTSEPELKIIEENLLKDINKLEIGPLGLGGKTTALAVKIEKTLRHPASFFVGISFGCWALRRASL